MHVWHVELIALVAHTFVEDLFEFFLWFEVHPKGKIKPTLARLWWRAICVTQIQLWCRRNAARAPWATAGSSSATSGSINQLAAIRAHFIRRNAGCKSSCPTITQAVAP